MDTNSRNKIFYSAARDGFFHSDMRHLYDNSLQGWPADAVEISERWFNYLMSKQQEGREITSDERGWPVLKRLDSYNWPEIARDEANRLIKRAMTESEALRTELALGMISDEDRALLVAWMAYVKALREADFSAVSNQSDVDSFPWPTPPACK